MTDFLPKGYEIPDKGGSYMKFVKGENRFRILGSPILGYEGWKTDDEGRNRPIRKRMTETHSVTEVDDPEKIKHFWALPVYNYQAEAIQILEITQKGIQKSLKSFASDSDWGNPREYDLVVVRDGDGMETSYEVMPKPKKEIDAGILKTYTDMAINLDALFDGADPFNDTAAGEKLVDEVDEGIEAAQKEKGNTPF